ncbi:type II secretion system F family protein [Agromyces humi]|uniref:type II secretion system F family protein n=1 Tax=Agromyces humi TaxID=1766800 RepID=UPI00135A0EBB|nr:type II secretion system F family protein [Agromyces humi]
MTDSSVTNPYEVDILRGRRAGDEVVAKALDTLATLLAGGDERAALEAAASRFQSYDIGRSFARATAGLDLGTMTLREVLAAEPVIPESVRRLVEYDLNTPVENILARAAQRITEHRTLQRRLWTSSLPGFVAFTAAAALVWVDATYIIPEYVNTFANLNADVPPLASTVVDAASVAQVVAVWALGAVVAAVLFLATFGRAVPAVRAAVERASFLIPGVGPAIKLAAVSRFLEVLGDLLAAGAPEREALRAAGEAAGPETFRRAGNAAESVADLASVKLLPESARFLFNANAGAVDQIARRSAQKYLAASNEQLDVFSRVAEPFGSVAAYTLAVVVVLASVAPLFAIAPALAAFTG